jgi:hypothetical protein
MIPVLDGATYAEWKCKGRGCQGHRDGEKEASDEYDVLHAYRI